MDDPATAPPADDGADTVDAEAAPRAQSATRRGVLAATGALAATVLAGPLLGTAAAQDDEDEPETIRLRAAVSGWVGQEPARIEDEENPTLYLDAGTEYRFVWENGDGVDHNLRLRNEAGDTVVTTETMGEEGATRSFTHTVTEDVVEYRCGIHGFSMRGEISFEDPPATTTTPTATETPPATTTRPETPTTSATPTATATPTPAPTDTGTQAGTTGVGEGGGGDGNGDDGSSDGGGLPGFGALAALAGVASALGLARKRRD